MPEPFQIGDPMEPHPVIQRVGEGVKLPALDSLFEYLGRDAKQPARFVLTDDAVRKLLVVSPRSSSSRSPSNPFDPGVNGTYGAISQGRLRIDTLILTSCWIVIGTKQWGTAPKMERCRYSRGGCEGSPAGDYSAGETGSGVRIIARPLLLP